MLQDLFMVFIINETPENSNDRFMLNIYLQWLGCFLDFTSENESNIITSFTDM